MSGRRVLLALVSVLWCRPCLGSGPDGITTRLLRPSPRTVLVRGKVDAVLERAAGDWRVPARVAVTHTYWGELPDGVRTLTDYYVAEGSIRYEAIIPFEVGEEGLWVVELPKAADPRRQFDPTPRVVARWRKKHDPRYPEGVKQAEFLEAVAKLEPGKRFAFALDRVTDPVPEVAMAAAHVAADADPARARDEVLKRVADGKVPVAAQIALDQALVARLGPDWRGSDRRRKFIAGWPAQAKDADALLLVVGDLIYRSQHEDVDSIPIGLGAGLIAAVAADETAPKAARLQAIGGLVQLKSMRRIVDPAFDCYTAVIEKSRDQDLRRRAAHNLPLLIDPKPAGPNVKPTLLTPVQIDRLHTLSKDEKDPDVRKLLIQAIEAAGAALAMPKDDR